MMKTWWAAPLALIFSGSALASELPEAIESCASLRRDAERLACFDKAVAALRNGSNAVPQVSAESMFGANAEVSQSLPVPGGVAREELKQITGTVTSLRHTNDGMMVLELDNGQVWRQQDVDVRLLVSQGETVTILRASLGTFRIVDKTGRFARFKRVR